MLSSVAGKRQAIDQGKQKMSNKVTFDGAPAAGTINFGVGQPSADLLPVEIMRAASAHFLEKALPIELNYGERQGDVRFRATLARFLSEHYFSETDENELFVTAGNSQALDFICSVFTKPGDTVIVEEPSYFLAFRIFLDHGLNIVSLPADDEGLRVDLLEKTLEDTRVKLIYTIPSYLNPGGQCMSLPRRKRLLELSQAHDFLIAADEVYQLLYYRDRPPPALGTMTDRGQVLSLGSFSKIMAPGLRLGWIQTSPALMEKLLDNGAVNSGGSLNHFTSHIMRHAIDMGLQAKHLHHLRDVYRRRVEAMNEALQLHLSHRARWLCPEGGYFFWLKFARTVDTSLLREHASEYKTGFQPGAHFSAHGGLNNYLRLSFAHYGEDDIREGVRRLASLITEKVSP
jgi:DNA-binding transcriptional MocR family regulator